MERRCCCILQIFYRLSETWEIFNFTSSRCLLPRSSSTDQPKDVVRRVPYPVKGGRSKARMSTTAAGSMQQVGKRASRQQAAPSSGYVCTVAVFFLACHRRTRPGLVYRSIYIAYVVLTRCVLSSFFPFSFFFFSSFRYYHHCRVSCSGIQTRCWGCLGGSMFS